MDPKLSRRTFLNHAASTAALASLRQSAAQTAGQVPPGLSKLLQVDMRRLVSRGDLVYRRPVERSEEGMPVGNGRMGTLVWTTPGQLRMQINRSDVYASNSASNSFFERNSDYCGGCAFLDVDTGHDVFPATGFRQHLSIYDGLLTIEGQGATARIAAYPMHDVFAIEIEDYRAQSTPIVVHLRMLRFGSQYYGPRVEEFARERINVVQTRSHMAASQLLIRGQRIALLQDFREGEFCCKSAVVVSGTGAVATPTVETESSVRLDLTPRNGRAMLLVGSAATFSAGGDVVGAAMREVDAVAGKTFSAIAGETADWWHQFWSRGFVHVDGDSDAASVEQNYAYFLYLMAATSRGKYPPKFNGMLWNTDGDRRTWGAQHWFANLSCYYEALPAANRMDLMDPMFDMYSGMLKACSVAAKQQWGSEGMYIPETVFFDGLERLPDDIAAEIRDLYLLRKPWDQRSQRFREYARTKLPHSSRWNWIQAGKWVEGRWVITERGSGPYGNVSHILGTTAKVAYLYWRKYEYTRDEAWLRDRAYSMLKAAAEFYRNFPTVQKGEDGQYHISLSNSNESVWGARDTDEDLSAMHGVVAVALKAADILDIDADLRKTWREFLDHLAPLPTSETPEALRPAEYVGPVVFVRGLKPAVKPGGLLPDANSLPMWFFDLCHAGSSDTRLLQLANATFASYFQNGITEKTPVSVLSKLAIAAAMLGKAEAARYLIPNQMRVLTPERSTAYKNGGVLANRMTLREGPQALDAQRLGRASEALHLALLQSLPPAPGEEPVLHVFPAWPKQWNASYTLLARGGFVVSSSIEGSNVAFVELLSNAGEQCRLRNPWEGKRVILYRDAKPAETLSGAQVQFATRVGEHVVVVVEGTRPEMKRVV